MAATIWAAAKDGDTATLARILRDCIHVGTAAAGTCACWTADAAAPVAVDARDVNGSTALMYACEKGRVEAASMLLRHGASVNARDKFGDTPLLFSCSWAHADIVRILLARGADPNIADMERDTPLIVAAGEGHVDVCLQLLAAGAGLHHVNETGWAPAHAAIANNRAAALALLLRAGVDPRAAESDIPTPWMLWHASRCASGAMDAHVLGIAVGMRARSASEGHAAATAAAGKSRSPSAVSPAGRLPSFIALAVAEAAHACVPVLVGHYLWHRRRPYLLMREALQRDGGDTCMAGVAGTDEALKAFTAAVMLPRELFRRIVAFL